MGTALALGCASPGPPQPPSLHLPDFASKLQAQRVGNEVRLTWLTPANTTDGVAVRGSVTAVVWREISQNRSAAQPMSQCSPVKRMTVAPGLAELTDVLPDDLSTGAATLLAYRIELLNDRGRSSGRSDAVYAAAGGSPAPVGPLTISSRRGAALIEWQAQPGATTGEASMEIHRTPAASAGRPKQITSEPTRPTGVPTHGPAGSLKAPAKTPFSAGKEPAGDITLTVEAKQDGAAKVANPKGTLDRTVRDGESYVYVAQRVNKVILQAKDLEIRGVASPPTPFAYRDTVPPKMPSGLVSVPGTGLAGAPSIDLSWEPNPENDVLGYNVYRQVGSGASAKLNPQPLPSSSFRDMQVALGPTYTYRVTAIDRRGNESSPSTEIHESLRQ